MRRDERKEEEDTDDRRQRVLERNRKNERFINFIYYFNDAVCSSECIASNEDEE
jgi:hypothetical protein